MKLINIKIPERDIEIIDSIVVVSRSGKKLTSCKYDNRSDFIRVAINALIEQERNAVNANKQIQTLQSCGDGFWGVGEETWRKIEASPHDLKSKQEAKK